MLFATRVSSARCGAVLGVVLSRLIYFPVLQAAINYVVKKGPGA